MADDEDPREVLVIVSPNYNRDAQLVALAEFVTTEMSRRVFVYTGMKQDLMKKFLKGMDDLAMTGVRSLVFIDDPVGTGSFTANVNQTSPFNSFVTGIKHYRADLIFSTQAVGSMSKSARKNVDVFIFLPDLISRKELYDSCRIVGSLSDFDRLMDAYASKPFHALWINVQFGSRGVYCIDQDGRISAITTVPP